MTVSDAHALVELLRRPGIEPLELSRRLGLSKSAVSRLLSRLKKRGQIRQQKSKADGRALNLHLTEKGERTAGMIDRESLKTFGRIASRLPRDTVELLERHLPLLIRALPKSRADLDTDVVRVEHNHRSKE